MIKRKSKEDLERGGPRRSSSTLNEQRGCHGSLQMEEDDKGCPMIRLGVSGVSVSSGTGLPGLSRTTAVKRLCVCVLIPKVALDSHIR